MVDRHSKVAIIMSRCSNTRDVFGIRIEFKEQGSWMANWAFAINAEAAKREGYNKTTIRGEFAIDADYPGCPYCSAPGFFKCNCGRIGCWNNSETVTCPWCHQSNRISGQIDSLEAGADR
jgi:hypothetical protein